MSNKRILVISHNPISLKQNNGKTLKSFLYNIEPSQIAQIYINGEYIDYASCKVFYKINEINIFKRIFKRNNSIGELIYSHSYKKYNFSNKTSSSKNKIKNILSVVFKKTLKLPFFELLRNFFWKISNPINDKNLMLFLDEFKPEIILYQASNIPNFSSFVMGIKRKTNAQLVMTITDDYLTKKYSFSVLDYYRTSIINKKYKECIENSKAVLVIGEKMLMEYKKKFPNGKYYIAMNSYDSSINSVKYKPKDDKFVILYAGNLGLSRWKTIVKLGKILDDININKKIELRVCSLSKIDYFMKKEFSKVKCLSFLGGLNSEDLKLEKDYSDLLLHVESFNKKDILTTRLSISTKIFEYINSNRSILAIGPKNIASIEYISKYQLGFTITEKNYKKWNNEVLKILQNEEQFLTYINNCKIISEKTFNSQKNISKIQKIIFGDDLVE